MAYAGTYQVRGTAAVKVQRGGLVLIEGGRTRSSAERGTTALLRVAVMAALLAAVFASASLLASASVEARREQALSSVPSASYVVRPGDSVWSIAEANPADGLTTAEAVSYIEGVNELSSACLVPGQVIEIPT